MAFDLNKYENQARASIGLAIFGAFCTLVLIVCLFYKAFDAHNFQVLYQPNSKRHMGILGSAAGAVIAGAIGFFMALNSAGQKRNKTPQLSWTAFFLNAVVITAGLSLLCFFYFVGYAVR